jgi:hypothetical protein
MGKRKVAGVAKDAVETVFRRIRNKPSEFLLEKASDLIRKFDKGEIKLPELKGQLRKRMKDSYSKIKKRQDDAEKSGYLKDYREKGKKVFKKNGGAIKKKKVVKLKVGGALTDYYKGMM